MTKDLSKDKYSATSTFMRILPRIKDINCMNMSENDKVELACKEIIDALKQTRKEALSQYKKSIRDDYIDGYKSRLQECLTVNDIIAKLRYSINKGRNYSGR